MQGKWTKGEWFPDDENPAFNPGANVYMRPILQPPGGRIVPGYAFGETEEECRANSWLIASTKDLLHAVQALLAKDPDAIEIANRAMYKAMGHLEP